MVDTVTLIGHNTFGHHVDGYENLSASSLTCFFWPSR